jgi:hypothetical protein
MLVDGVVRGLKCVMLSDLTLVARSLFCQSATIKTSTWEFGETF